MHFPLSLLYVVIILKLPLYAELSHDNHKTTGVCRADAARRPDTQQ